MTLSINIDLYLDSNNFGLTIGGLTTADFDVVIEKQKPGKLKEVSCIINYRKSIAKRMMSLLFNDANARRRLY